VTTGPGTPPQPRLYDAHNHLQDKRFEDPHSLWKILEQENIQKIVVNGSCEEDWSDVLNLASGHPQVIPSFGYHPWYINERSADWKSALSRFLSETPSAIGEIGLDRWIKDYDLPQQEEVFVWQLRLAAERNLPASIHCLEAWGKLLDLLRRGPRPQCGFVLHSFGGPQQMIDPLADLGAYFSLPGYFAHERKGRQREAFRHVPVDRLLIETDAPDQPLPPKLERYRLRDSAGGKPLNHPGNLAAVYEFAAGLLNQPLEKLAATVERNFLKLFGNLCP
jgi:TatD DNase family protein